MNIRVRGLCFALFSAISLQAMDTGSYVIVPDSDLTPVDVSRRYKQKATENYDTITGDQDSFFTLEPKPKSRPHVLLIPVSNAGSSTPSTSMSERDKTADSSITLYADYTTPQRFETLVEALTDHNGHIARNCRAIKISKTFVPSTPDKPGAARLKKTAVPKKGTIHNRIELVLEDGVDREDFVKVLKETRIQPGNNGPKEFLTRYLLEINTGTHVSILRTAINNRYYTWQDKHTDDENLTDNAYASFNGNLSQKDAFLVYTPSGAACTPFTFTPPLKETEKSVREILNNNASYQTNLLTICTDDDQTSDKIIDLERGDEKSIESFNTYVAPLFIFNGTLSPTSAKKCKKQVNKITRRTMQLFQKHVQSKKSQVLWYGSGLLGVGAATAVAYHMHKTDQASFWKRIFTWGAGAATGLLGILTSIPAYVLYEEYHFLHNYSQEDLQKDLQKAAHRAFTTDELLLKYRVAWDNDNRSSCNDELIIKVSDSVGAL